MSSGTGLDAALPLGAATDCLRSAFGIPFRTRTDCPRAAAAIAYQYRHLRATSGAGPEPIDLRIILLAQDGDDRGGAGGGPGPRRAASPGDLPEYSIEIDGEPVARVAGTGHLLHEIDNQLAYRLQCRGPAFYFVHGAAFARSGGATLLAGDSGAGKSTTAVALATTGLRYLSDELAAIRLDSAEIQPYPRAICLKNDPPPPLSLPATALRTEWTIHAQADELGATVDSAPARLERFVYLTGRPCPAGRPLRRISRGEAAMRLYQNALNQLAHPESGLDGTIELVSRAECYELHRTRVDVMLEALREAGAF